MNLLHKIKNWWNNEDDLSKALLICTGLVFFAIFLMLTPPVSITRDFLVVLLTGTFFVICYFLNCIGKKEGSI